MSIRNTRELKISSSLNGDNLNLRSWNLFREGYFGTDKLPKAHWKNNTFKLTYDSLSYENRESYVSLELSSGIDKPDGDSHCPIETQHEDNKLGTKISKKNEFLKWNPCSYWYFNSYWCLTERKFKFKFDPLWEIYSNLENKTVELDLKSEYQKQFSAEVTIVVLANHKEILSDPVSFIYKAKIQSYQPSEKDYLIPRLSNPEEIHEVLIFWDNDSNQFRILFNSYDAEFLDSYDIQI